MSDLAWQLLFTTKEDDRQQKGLGENKFSITLPYHKVVVSTERVLGELRIIYSMRMLNQCKCSVGNEFDCFTVVSITAD